ncbi:MAG: ATP-binding protein [Bacteroidota bacterium]
MGKKTHKKAYNIPLYRSFSLVPYQYKEEFLKEITFNNHNRFRSLIILVFLYAILMFVSDFMLISNISTELEKKYFILDLVLIGVLILLFIISKFKSVAKSEEISPIHTYLIWTFSAFLLIWSAVVSGIEFYYSPSFTTYLIVVFLIAGLFFIRGWIFIIMLLSSVAVILFMVFSSGIDPSDSYPGFYGLLILVPLAYIVSRFLFISRMQQFVQKKELVLLNQDLEQRVKKRTAELEEKNDNLRNEIFIRKSYEKTLKEARRKAEESDYLKTAFLANMSHEIRTPMNGIVGFSQLLRRPALSEEKKSTYLDIIYSNSLQLQSIINDIIDLSKIESNQISIEKEYFDINQLLEEKATFFNEYVKIERKHDIKVKVTGLLDEDDKIIYADKVKVTQILNNLLKNAIKFTTKGSVTIRCYIEKEELHLEVTDTGIGIRKEDLFIIFERFRQADNSARRKYGGAGLGLSITRGLVNKMQGKIKVDSEPGKGSIFTVSIPYEKHENDKIMDGEIPELDWSMYTFLIVEDDLTSRFFLEEILHPTGVRILTCDNGIRAFEICKDNSDIDLVLMDIQLPGMDGYTTTRKIKKIKPDIKIIAQTANAFSEDKSRCLDAGCDAYLSKPIEPSKLFSALFNYLDQEKKS